MRLKPLAVGIAFLGLVTCRGLPAPLHETAATANEAMLKERVEEGLKTNSFPKFWFAKNVVAGSAKITVVLPDALKGKMNCTSCHSLDDAAKSIAESFVKSSKRASLASRKNWRKHVPEVLIAPTTHQLTSPAFERTVDGTTHDFPKSVVIPVMSGRDTRDHEAVHVGQEHYLYSKEPEAYFTALLLNQTNETIRPQERFLVDLINGLQIGNPKRKPSLLSFTAATTPAGLVIPNISKAVLDGFREYRKNFLHWNPLIRRLGSPELPVDVVAAMRFPPAVPLTKYEKSKGITVMRFLLQKGTTGMTLKEAFMKKMEKPRRTGLAAYYHSLKQVLTGVGKVAYGGRFLPCASALGEAKEKTALLEEHLKTYSWHAETVERIKAELSEIRQRAKRLPVR